MSYYCIRGGGECIGCMECKGEPPEHYCPICGEKVEETYYLTNDGEIVGCENCITTKEPQEVNDD